MKKIYVVHETEQFHALQYFLQITGMLPVKLRIFKNQNGSKQSTIVIDMRNEEERKKALIKYKNLLKHVYPYDYLVIRNVNSLNKKRRKLSGIERQKEYYNKHYVKMVENERKNDRKNIDSCSNI